jgi:CheY-like chemotaxis protein
MTGLPILLVEDDEDVLDAIREVLEDAGYVVATARSGFEALASLTGHPVPAAMVVDFMMSGMNGADLLRACAADPRLEAMPTLVMSAARPADLAGHGIHSYLPKPFSPEQLLEALNALCSYQKRFVSG